MDSAVGENLLSSRLQLINKSGWAQRRQFRERIWHRGFGCPFRNNRSANSENDERRGMCLIDDVSMEQQDRERERNDPKSHPSPSGEGLVERSCILSTSEVALRPRQYFTSFVCPVSPSSTYSPTAIQRISAYLNNTSFVIRVIILICDSCARKWLHRCAILRLRDNFNWIQIQLVSY